MDQAGAKTALILSGGGARAAYQIGVLSAIAKLVPCAQNPFPIVVGTSAGAINAVALASGAEHFPQALDRLANIWRHIECRDIYRTDWFGVLNQARRFIWHSLLGVGAPVPVALLDNTPLQALLQRELDTNGIVRALRAGALEAVAVTAFDYAKGQSVVFYQARQALAMWQRYRRQGVATRLQIQHLLASSAIPLLFKPVAIDERFYGDGALRQLAPISPALRLGAKQVLIIGVHASDQSHPLQNEAVPPSLAQISGQLLNSAFIDNLEADIEVLERLNQLADGPSSLEPIKVLTLRPSRSLEQIAAKHRKALPRSIRTFIKGSGATDHGSGEVLSYLLFSGEYCRELMVLGYEDGLAQHARIQAFFSPS